MIGWTKSATRLDEGTLTFEASLRVLSLRTVWHMRSVLTGYLRNEIDHPSVYQVGTFAGHEIPPLWEHIGIDGFAVKDKRYKGWLIEA